MYLEPIYNSFFQTYQNVITLNCKPPGPLSNMVTSVNLPKLSPFQEPGPMFDMNTCTYVLLRYPVAKVGAGNSALKNNHALMGADDIASVFGYLQNNGYKIDSSTTSMLQDGRVLIGGVSDKRYSGNRRMIAMIQYG